MRRVVEPELLDALPPEDPQAVGSRADLRRLNFWMGHAGFLTRAFCRRHERSPFRSRSLRLVELGGGDGTLLLRLARRWSALSVTAEATLVDRQSLVSSETRRAFTALGWSVESMRADVVVWLEQAAAGADVMLANLFLHHFPEASMAKLLRLAGTRTNLFLACEPRRSLLSLTAARSLALLGCNPVTRHDAAVSVRAGFAGRELSALWPKSESWELAEGSVGLFSHGFVATRNV